MKFIIPALLLTIGFASAHASEEAGVGSDNKASFSWIHKNIIQPKCLMCHSATQGDGDGLVAANFDDYTGVLKMVKIGDPEHSPIYIAVKTRKMPRPMEGMPAEPLNDDELRALSDWIAAGAPND